MSTVFKRIIDGELPCDKVYEDDQVIAFKDIAPAAPVHILIVPKKQIDRLQNASEEDLSLVAHCARVAQKIAEEQGISDGYRFLTNNGREAGQTVFHLHFHLLGGRQLGPLG
jgi:histidine triad (HIT) family protein